MTTDTTAQDTTQAANAGASQNAAATQDTGAGQDTAVAKTALTQDANPDAGKTDAGTDTQKASGDTQNQSDPKDGQGQDKGDKVDGAPESYADFTLPENMEVNAAALDKFKGMAKAVNLPQAQAQEFVSMGAELVQEAVENVHTAWVESYAKKVEGWHATRLADAEIGGNEQASKLALSEASRVARSIGGDALMNALDETGAGNHPEIIRAFYRMRQAVGPDGKLILGNQGGGSPKSLAQTIYPNHPSST